MTDATANAQERPSAPHGRSFHRVGFIFAGWSALHLLVTAALTQNIVPGGWFTFLAIYATLLVLVVLLLRGFRDEAYPTKARRLFVTRPFWYAQIALLPMSVLGGLGWLAGLPFGRALAWGRGALLVATILVAILIVGGYVGSRRLVTKRIEFAYPDLPKAFDGVTIAQLSDLHVGPQTSDRYLRRVVREVEKARPDLIAFTGDQVDDHDHDVGRFAAFFGPLRAPLGSFAIAGNHDVYAGWPGVRAGMEAAGMRVLVNDAMPVTRAGEALWIIGTGDPAGLGSFGQAAPEVAPDIARSLARVPPGAFTLALAHNPALWPALAQRGVHVTLSGHTHHGQLSIPVLNWCLASPFLEFAMGAYTRGRSRLYVSPGTNYWGLPVRLGAWPEVTIVTLRLL